MEDWLRDFDTRGWPPGARGAAIDLGELLAEYPPINYIVQTREDDGWRDVAWLGGCSDGYYRYNETTMCLQVGDDGSVILDFNKFQEWIPRQQDSPPEEIMTLVFKGMRVILQWKE